MVFESVLFEPSGLIFEREHELNVRELVKKCMKIHSYLFFVFFASFRSRETRFFNANGGSCFFQTLFSISLISCAIFSEPILLLFKIYFLEEIVKNGLKLTNGRLNQRKNNEIEWNRWERCVFSLTVKFDITNKIIVSFRFFSPMKYYL